MINTEKAHKPDHSKLLGSMGNYEFIHFVITGTQSQSCQFNPFISKSVKVQVLRLSTQIMPRDSVQSYPEFQLFSSLFYVFGY